MGESLAKAFAVAASKPAEHRGAFDQATLQQTQTEFAKYQASLAAKMETASAAVDAAKLKEKAAEEMLVQAQSAMGKMSRELRTAELAILDGEDGMCAAEERRRETSNEIRLGEVSRHRLVREVEEFQAGPVAFCSELCAKRKEQVAAANSGKSTADDQYT